MGTPGVVMIMPGIITLSGIIMIRCNLSMLILSFEYVAISLYE